ncbi:MAG: hypothetical protein IT208_08360 [Chthonomonadales bacterium]|nr:hypothetical protein [Chthonomonadales bacterium]
MKRWSKTLAVTLSLVAVLGVTASGQLGQILKGGGIAFLVSNFGKDINKALNKLTNTRDRTEDYATKVVPVLSAGQGTAVGAVQVMGPPAAVDRVQAVAQVEGNFRALGVRIRALVPVETRSITNIKRVPGVGISGLLDIKL